MTDEKLFYKYQSLEEKTDKGGKKRNYTIESLSKNQLYFSDPTEFNDPFDCKVYFDDKGTKEQWIQWHINNKFSREEAIDRINKYFEAEDDLIYPRVNKEFHTQVRRSLHGDLKKKGLKRVCCFSGTCRSILMWSHYANSHQGICLRFRYEEDTVDGSKYLSLFTDQVVKAVSVDRDKECCSPFYKTNITRPCNMFSKVDYQDEIPPVNIFDSFIIEKIEKCFQTKFREWTYEDEYRVLLPESVLENGLIKYDKEDLEGVIFGLKINNKNAKLVYETIKKNYLDEGITVNFYESIEVIGKYEVKVKKIPDIIQYINNLPI